MATKTSRIPRKAKRFFWAEIFCLEYPSTRSEKGNVHFANYRFSFRKLQISISQTTDFHFVSSHFVSFHFVSSHFVSQTTVSLINRIQRNDSTESVNLTCQPATALFDCFVRLFCSTVLFKPVLSLVY